MAAELGVQGFAITVPAVGGDDAVKERIARMLCPVEDHNGPCEVPWGFTRAGGGDDLVVRIYSSAEKAAEILERVKAVVGEPVDLVVGDPADFEDLATQYRIENEHTS
ncbi:hypothetical protein [Kribbella sp. CA-294648]|uniref:hypothetical protein n=1 Tax=Kribbella sp. CA-294648 TaxID=3239948 RepID=UPI003D8ABF28